jgi:hypothetical protein
MNSLKHSFTYSFAAIIISIALSMTLFYLSYYESALNYLSYVAFIAFLVIGLKAYRDKVKGGIMTYGQAMGYGTWVALVYSVFIAIWTYIFFQYIAHDEIQQLQAVKMDESMQMMREKYHMSESDIERSMKMAKMFSSPGVITVFALVINMFLLTVVNLIVAAVMKKDPPENFDNTQPNPFANSDTSATNPYTN